MHIFYLFLQILLFLYLLLQKCKHVSVCAKLHLYPNNPKIRINNPIIEFNNVGVAQLSVYLYVVEYEWKYFSCYSPEGRLFRYITYLSYFILKIPNYSLWFFIAKKKKVVYVKELVLLNTSTSRWAFIWSPGFIMFRETIFRTDVFLSPCKTKYGE